MKVIAYIGLPFLLSAGVAIAEMEVSDHFDGEKFHNPTMTEPYAPGFSDVFRMMREGRPDWPETVVSTPAPKLNLKLQGDEIGITFIGHATFLIQLPGLNILTDPVWSNRVGPVSWLGPKRVKAPGISLDQLPKIDIVLISHNHYDHLDVETLEKLNERFAPKVYVPVGDKALLESIGVIDVEALDWWGSSDINTSTRVTFTPTQHSSRRGLFDLDKSLWGSYFIRHGASSLYFGGDAAYSTHYAEIRTRLGEPDIAMLPIGDYLPSWFMQPIHMNPPEAVTAHKDLGAKRSIAMHFGTFQNSAVAYGQPVAELTEASAEARLEDNEFAVLATGETFIYSGQGESDGQSIKTQIEEFTDQNVR